MYIHVWMKMYIDLLGNILHKARSLTASISEQKIVDIICSFFMIQGEL